jgi:hypothetical protein
VPPRFRHCCEVFRAHTTTCELDVRYEWWPKANRWFIAILDSAGGGGIEIGFCPHCGRQLEHHGSSNRPLERAGVTRRRESNARRAGRSAPGR